MTIQTAVLIETINSLISDLRWFSCDIFSTQEHTVDVIVHDESSDVFYWKGESLNKCWDCILNTLI